jgi:RHS repeat-associated protein
MVQNGTTYRILTDHLGSPRLVVDASDGTVVQRMAYDEFGQLLARHCPFLSSEDCKQLHPFGFAGGLHDPDTWLVRFRARDYSPEVGRFVSKDPLSFAATDTNLYSYAGSDPVNLADPSGLYCTYSQSTGQLSCYPVSVEGPQSPESLAPYYEAIGYAGAGVGRNNPAMQDEPFVGPVPRGPWAIGDPYNSPNTGRNTMRLDPLEGNECLEPPRDCGSFRIHGDNATNNASEGCIVLPPNRTRIPPGEILLVVQ